MKTLFKSKLLWVTLIALLLCSTYCFATSSVTPTSDEGIMPISEDSEIAPISEEEETNGTTSTPDLNNLSFVPDIYRADQDISVSEMVNGNAFLFGNNVTISGQIYGDVFVCAGNLTITDTAYISGNIFACAKSFSMAGIAYDIYAAVESFDLKPSALIARDIKIGASSVSIAGTVNKDAFLSVDTLNFYDEGEDSAPYIAGNFNYTSGTEVTIPENVVNGQVNFTPVSKDKHVDIGSLIVSYINKILSAILYSFVVLLLIAWLTPNFMNKATNLMKKKAPLAFGIGLLVSICTIIGSIALIFLTGGLAIHVSFALLALYFLVWTICETVFALAIGKLLANKFKFEKTFQAILLAILVVLVINLLKLIPFVGTIIGLVSSIIGLGIIFLNLVLKEENKVE